MLGIKLVGLDVSRVNPDGTRTKIAHEEFPEGIPYINDTSKTVEHYQMILHTSMQDLGIRETTLLLADRDVANAQDACRGLGYNFQLLPEKSPLEDRPNQLRIRRVA